MPRARPAAAARWPGPRWSPARLPRCDPRTTPPGTGGTGSGPCRGASPAGRPASARKRGLRRDGAGSAPPPAASPVRQAWRFRRRAAAAARYAGAGCWSGSAAPPWRSCYMTALHATPAASDAVRRPLLPLLDRVRHLAAGVRLLRPAALVAAGRDSAPGALAGRMDGIRHAPGGYTWIMHVLRVFAFAPPPLAFLGYLLVCVVQGFLFGVMSSALVWVGRRTRWPATALLPLALVATEFA